MTQSRLLPFSILCTVFFGAVVFCNASIANGGSAERSAFLVSVFDCYMPVPDDFVLNSLDKSGTVLFLGADLEAMRIVIKDYEQQLGENFSVISQRSIDELTV